MRKVIVLLVLLMVAGSHCAGSGWNNDRPVRRLPIAEAPEMPLEEKDWTILIYNAADFYGTNPTEAYAAHFRSTEAAHVVMLEDPLEGDAAMWYLTGIAGCPILTCVAEWGEVDMSTEQTFARFLEFGTQCFPSKRTIVMIYQHGYAWKGVCYDAHPESDDPAERADMLSPEEMRSALAGVGGVDGLFMTAPCLAGSLELAYQLRNEVDVYMASEAPSSLSVWRGGFPVIMEALSQGSGIDLLELGKAVCDAVAVAWPVLREELVTVYRLASERLPHETLSAIDCTRLDEVGDALDGFALALLAKLEVFPGRFDRTRENVQLIYGHLIDAYDLAAKCRLIHDMSDASERLMEAISDAVYASITNPLAFPDAHGLSLHFPRVTAIEYEDAQQTYLSSGLDLIEQTHWDEFLEAFCGAL